MHVTSSDKQHHFSTFSPADVSGANSGPVLTRSCRFRDEPLFALLGECHNSDRSRRMERSVHVMGTQSDPVGLEEESLSPHSLSEGTDVGSAHASTFVPRHSPCSCCLGAWLLWLFLPYQTQQLCLQLSLPATSLPTIIPFFKLFCGKKRKGRALSNCLLALACDRFKPKGGYLRLRPRWFVHPPVPGQEHIGTGQNGR